MRLENLQVTTFRDRSSENVLLGDPVAISLTGLVIHRVFS